MAMNEYSALQVEFMAPDCQDCLALVPQLRKVASNLKGIATVGTVNCADADAAKTCRAYGVQRVPRVVVFKPGTGVNPYTGDALKEYQEYAGPAIAKALAAAVTDTLDDSLVDKISSSQQHAEFLQKQPELAKVLLFTDKAATTVLYKALSWAYQHRLAFSEVRTAALGQAEGGNDGSSSGGLVEEYGVTGPPALVLVKPDGTKERYSGPLKAAPLREFLDQFAAKEAVAGGAPRSSKGGATGPSGQSPEPFGEVILHNLTAGNLTDIMQQDDMWLLAFYSSTTDDNACASQLEQLKKLLQDVQGIVRYGTVNVAAAAAPSHLKALGVDEASLQADGCGLQVVLLPFGDDKDDVSRWAGGLDDAKALQDWILQQVPDFTSLLTSELEANAFVQAAGAVHLGSSSSDGSTKGSPTGKVFLFSTKQEVPGVYKALAMQLHGKANLMFAWTTPDTTGPGPAMMKKMN
eukprot:gene11263-11412_t